MQVAQAIVDFGRWPQLFLAVAKGVLQKAPERHFGLVRRHAHLHRLKGHHHGMAPGLPAFLGVVAQAFIAFQGLQQGIDPGIPSQLAQIAGLLGLHLGLPGGRYPIGRIHAAPTPNPVHDAPVEQEALAESL